MRTEKELYESFVKRQEELFLQADFMNCISLEDINTVCGVDLAYWNRSGQEFAVCCVVVIDVKTKKVIGKASNSDIIPVPYIPTCLGFREVPLVFKTLQAVKGNIDLIVFDGNGYLHPRHMGLATHAGILLNKPTIGVAKTYYKVDGNPYPIPGNEVGDYTDIIIDGEIYGRALRTHEGVKPIFISVGNRVDLDTASELMLRLTGPESHVPMPTRIADIMTHQERFKKIYERN